MCMAESRTSTDAVMLVASRRSRTTEGTGTSITKTSVTAAMGRIQSAAPVIVVRVPGASGMLPHFCRLGAIDHRQNFGHHGVELGGNRLTNFNRTVQRMGERRILDL